jgi:uncharacterized membrane protein
LKKYFITGLLIWIPLVITIWVLSRGFSARWIQPCCCCPTRWQPQNLVGFAIPGLGVILTLLIVLLSGLIGHNIIGQRLIRFWEGLLSRIPVVKSIYNGVKQVSGHAVFEQRVRHSARRCWSSTRAPAAGPSPS